MKVRVKLIIGFSAIVICLWLIVTYAGNNYGNLKQQFTAVEKDIIPNTMDLTEVEKTAYDAYRQSVDYVLFDMTEAKQNAIYNINHLNDIRKKYQSYGEGIEDEEYIVHQELISRINMLTLGIITVMNVKEMGASRDELLAQDHNISLPALLDLEHFINEQKAANIEELTVVKTDFQQAYTQGINWLLISAGLITFIAVAAAFLTTRSITRPLHALHKGTEIIAKGNLDYKVGTKAHDEIGQLSRAFDQMTLNLTSSMTSIDNLNQEIAERKRAEEALRESEAKYSSLVERGNDGIVILQDGVIKYANSKMVEMLDYSVEETINKPFINYVSPEHKELVIDRYRKRIAGKEVPLRYEFDIISKDGKTVNVEVNASLLEYKGTIADMAIIRDVTERKRAEEALRESEEKFSKGFYASPDIMCLVNLENNKFIEANDSFTRYTGYTRDEVIGHTSTELGIWANPEERERIIKTLHEQGRVSNEEIHTRTKSGEIRIGMFSAETIHIGGELYSITVIVDITERKRAEEALRESEEKFYKAFRSSPDAIAITTLKDGRFIEVNDSYTRITGFTREEVIGHTTSELGHWGKPGMRDRLIRTLTKRGRISNEEVHLRLKSGEHTTSLFSAELIHISGEPCMISVTTDITERKKREQLQQDENYVLTLIGQGAELSQLLDAIVRLGEKHNPSIKGSVLLYDSSKDRLVQASGPSLPDDFKELLKDGLPIGLNVGSCGTAAYKKQRVIVTDIKNSPLFEPFKETVRCLTDNGLLSCWSEPIISSNGELLGTIANYGNKLGEPNADSLRVLEWSTKVAAIAIERKQAEEALQNSYEKFMNIFQEASDGFIYLDQSGRILDVNKQALQIFGGSKEILLGKHFTNIGIFSKTDIPTIMSGFAQVLIGQKPSLNIAIKNKKGEKRDLECSAKTVNMDNKISGVLVSVRDITERQRAEEALANEATRRRILIEQSRDGIVILDQNCKVYEANQRFAEMIGYSPEEVRELHVWDWEFQFPREQVMDMVRSVDETGDHFETQHKRKDSTIYNVEISTNGATIAGQKLVFCVCRDITERKRAEEALRINEERFRLIADNATDMISRIQTVPTIRTDYISPSCYRITGYKQEEFYTDPNLGLQMIHPDDREFFQKHLLSDNKKHHKPITIRLVRKDGSIIWIEQTHAVISDEHSETVAMHLIARDITARKEAEEALRLSEQKFSKAFRSSPNTIAITTLKDGKFIEVNDSFTHITGYTRDEVIGRSSKDIAIWAKTEDRERMLKMLKEKGQIYNEEFDFRIKSGEIRTWLFSGELIDIGDELCIISMTIDITELKKAQTALSESEEKFSKAFSSSPDIISIVNIISNKFIEVNDNFCNFTGYSRDEVIGHSAPEIEIWAMKEDRDRILKIMNKQGRVSNEEFHLRTKSGEIRLALFSSEQILIGGEPCSIAVVIDITESKAAEEKLKQTLAELESSSAQLAATNKELESFSYSVSHDLRSPLRSIDGFSQALLEDYENKLDKTGKDYLQRLRGASQKMGELIDGILNLSRLTRSEMHKEKVNLSALAEEITARLHEDQPERDADFVIGKGLIDRGDPQLLRALFENLLGNAWKFTSKREKTRIEFGITKNGEKKTYFINDNGAGFDMTYADKLFGAFQRLHETSEFPGTGIGLATVQRIINRHGGSIWAEGAVGKGATFYFTLN
jgi:PAS domain S-box-containing protein